MRLVLAMDPKERDVDRANTASIFAPPDYTYVAPSGPLQLQSGQAARALLRILRKARARELGEELTVTHPGDIEPLAS